MKKRSRWSRALSIVLAMLMILSNSAITTYADIIGGVSQQGASGGNSGDPINLENALETVTVAKANGEDYDPNRQYPRDTKFEFNMHYKFAEDNKPTKDGVRTATYQLPAGLNISDGTGYISCEGYTAGHAGEYSISNGMITFTYYPEFLEAHSSDIEGNFTFEAGLKESETVNRDSTTINFPGNGTVIPIEIKFEGSKVSGNKTYTLNEDGTVDFTIKLNVTGKDAKNFSLKDVQGSNLKFADDPQFKLDGTLIASDKVTVSGDNATLNLGELTVGEHTITYKAALKDLDIVDGAPNKNTANWTFTGGDGRTDTTVKGSESKLKKSGSIVKNNNGEYEITWNVIYVPGTNGSVAGKTFTDTLGADQEYTGSYQVYYDENGNEWYCGEGNKIAEGEMGNGKSFSYTFPSDQNSKKGAYKLVYKTKVTKDLSNITTKEVFSNQINGDGKNAAGTVEINPPSPTGIPALDIIKKTGVADSKNRKATWTVTVNPDGKTVKNLVVVDELQDFYNWKGKYNNDVVVTENGTPLANGTEYTLSSGTSGSGNPTMTVTFLKEITGVVTITYSSDYNDSSETGWTGNKIHSTYTVDNNNQTEDDYGNVEFKKDYDVAKNGSISGEIANWKITINDLEGGNRGELREDAKTIIDKIPAGMEYVEGSLKCSIDKDHWGSNSTESWDEVSVSYDETTRKLTIIINNLDLSKDAYPYIELTYQTRLKNVPTESGDGVTVDGNKISFTNHVTVGDKTESATVDVNSKALEKSGRQLESPKNVVEYTIGVNYASEDLIPNSDTLTLEDVLDTNLTLDTSSVRVTDMFTGEAVSYQAAFGTNDAGNNTMTLTIPDGQALKVTYRASLVTADKVNGTTYEVSNDAVLRGETEVSTSTKTQVKYEKTSADVSGRADSITVKKVDNVGNALPGATFVVQKVVPDTLSPDGEAIEKQTNQNGFVKFEKLSYNTLYYYQETKAPDGYKIRDNEKHYFIIKNVKNDSNANRQQEYKDLINKIPAGTKFADISGGQTFTIQNDKVNTPATAQVEAEKTVNDQEAKGSQFSFTLTPKTEGDENTEQTVKNKNGKITFAELKYSKAGTYEYELSEDQEVPEGYTADGTVHTVTVTVTDNGKGQLESKVTYDEDADKVVFANTYKASGTTAQVEAEKTVNGEEAKGSQFSFTLTPKTAGDENTEQTVQNENGKITFAPLSYSKAGTYEYELSEVQKVPNGYTADQTKHKVTVEVKDNGEGQLVAEVTYDADADKVVFANTYKASGTTAQVEAEKTVNGEEAKGSQFSFTLTPKTEGDKNAEQTVQNENGKITFAKLNYSKAGTYEYELSEVQKVPSGYTADQTKHKVTVKVTDNGKGQLEAKVTYDEDADKVVFANTYEASGTTAQVEAEKTVNDQEAKGSQFSFTLTPKTEGDENTEQTVKNENGKITFDKLNYSKVGTYEYELSEVQKVPNGYTADQTKHKVTVKVTDNGKGQLEAKVTYDEDADKVVFANTYEASGTTAQVEAEKTVNDQEAKGSQFSFTLTPKTAGDENTEQTVKNKNGKITFAELKYSKAGTYEYELSEDQEVPEGYTADGTVHTVTVTVTDNGKGQLESKVTYDEDVAKVVFANTYKASGTTAQVEAEKTVNGEEATGSQFSFTLKPKTEGDKNAEQTVKNENGKITFDKLNYSKVGTYEYELSEVQKVPNGYTADQTKHKVTVEVKDNGEGQLVAEVTYDADADKVVFANTYKASGTTAQVEAEKTVNGEEAKGSQFSFTLTPKTEGDKNAEQTVQNENGKITFAKLNYSKAGTYEYELSEVQKVPSGYTADQTKHKVTVKVTDNGKGQLEAKVTYDADKVVFANTYAAKGRINLTAEKFLTGKTLNAGDYNFVLADADNQILSNKKNDAEGNVTFDEISYQLKDVGVHTYYVYEKNESGNGVTCDDTVYRVDVTVSDNGDGTLKVEKKITTEVKGEDGKGSEVTPVEKMTFHNQYHASGETQFSGTKTLLGNRNGSIKEGEFTFLVLDKENNVVTTGKTLAADEAGKAEISFEPISYTEKDAGKTYTYTVREETGKDENITYDTTTYQITVKVSDNLDGTLKTEVTYPENGLVFTNSYKAAGTATLNTTKTLEGRTAALKANEFVFSLYEVAADGTKTPVLDKNGNPMHAFNDAEGNVIFGEISYDQDDQGTHSYEIVEEAGNDSAVTYDEEPVKANVKVSDKDGSGVLTTEVAYEKEGHTSFKNEYHANGKVTFTGLKKLTGNRAAEVKEGEFTFTVTDDATKETVATGKTKDGGVIEFTEISYTEKDKGQHAYTITEDKGSDESITYSEESVKVTVNVTDNNDGSLEAVAIYPEGGVVFTNAYNAKEEVVLTASKTFTGSTLAADQFSFELKDEQGEVLQTKKNDVDGKITFDGLEYTEQDIDKTYTYTVSETDNKITGVTYDKTVYTVKVQIKDSKDSDGTLDITTTTQKNGEAAEAMTFVNKFAGTVKLVKTSTEGRILPDAEFALYAKKADSDDFELYTADNDKGLYTTDAKGEILVKNLPANDYYFIETKAPDGYRIQKAEDGTEQKYSFRIGIMDGDAGVVKNAKVNAELTAENDINGTNNITVTKKITYIDPDTFEEKEMTWPNQTFYVNLFVDPEGTVPYRSTTPKAFEVSRNSIGTVTFENVSKGTYYVFETDADGNSIPMDEEMQDSDGKRYTATVEEGGSNQVDLDVQTDAEEGKVNLVNRYIDLPGGAAYKAWIDISKKVLKGTEAVDVDDTFYAGIFTKNDDGEYELYQIVELLNNDTVETEVTLGGEDGNEPITYYVFETDVEGNPVDETEFAYTVTGEGTVTVDKQNTTAKITITNTVNEKYSLLIRKIDENRNALAGAKFQITDGEGNVIDTWTSALKNHPVSLEAGTYKLSELTAPEGYKQGSEVTITVDEEGGITVESEIDGDVEFEEDESALDYINYPETTVTTTPSANITPAGGTTTRTGVKTGDDTPIALYILLLAVAACAAGGAVTAGRKKKKNR